MAETMTALTEGNTPMFRKVLSFGGMLLLAGAAVLMTAGPGQARGPVGGRFGGAHFGGAHFGGYPGGFYRGGYHYHPYYGYGHHDYPYYGRYPYYYDYRRYGYGYFPYSYSYYPYGYGYFPYSYGYYPYAYGYSPYYGSYSDDSSWYPGLDEAYSPGYGGGFTSVSPLSGGSQGLSPSVPADTTARVTVRVPAGADIWINGSQTGSAGPVREFQSAPLTRGQQHTYEFRARWKDDDGREVTQTQQVDLTAGAHARLDFPVPGGAPVTKGR
jgi:uncharacterized protein (TIGR03000 family)